MGILVRNILFDNALLFASFISCIVYLGFLDLYLKGYSFCGENTFIITQRLLLFAPVLLLLARALGIIGMLLVLGVLFPVDNALHILLSLVLLISSKYKVIPVLLLAYLLQDIGYNPDLVRCGTGDYVVVTTAPPTVSTALPEVVQTTTIAPTGVMTTAAPEVCAPVKCSIKHPPRDVIASLLCNTNCSTTKGPITTVDEWLAQECDTIVCGTIPPFGDFEKPLYGADNYHCGVWVFPMKGTFLRCTKDLDQTTTTTTPKPTSVIPVVVSGPF